MQIKMREIPRRVYIRYGLLTIPETVALILVLIVVRNWVPIPIWLWVTLIMLWIAKEIILFPFVWRAYDHTQFEVSHSMIGKRGITKERLAPTGYILVKGELWKAEKTVNEPPIEKNIWVRVKKIDGLKLFVVPEKAEDRGQKTEGRG
jgi:membrane-bound ClpP family serine protease